MCYTWHIRKHFFIIFDWMLYIPSNDKVLNAILFDQLTLVERIERCLKSGGQSTAEAEIEILKNEINRKLYQQLPLKSE